MVPQLARMVPIHLDALLVSLVRWMLIPSLLLGLIGAYSVLPDGWHLRHGTLEFSFGTCDLSCDQMPESSAFLWGKNGVWGGDTKAFLAFHLVLACR